MRKVRKDPVVPNYDPKSSMDYTGNGPSIVKDVNNAHVLSNTDQHFLTEAAEHDPDTPRKNAGEVNELRFKNLS